MEVPLYYERSLSLVSNQIETHTLSLKLVLNYKNAYIYITITILYPWRCGCVGAWTQTAGLSTLTLAMVLFPLWSLTFSPRLHLCCNLLAICHHFCNNTSDLSSNLGRFLRTGGAGLEVRPYINRCQVLWWKAKDIWNWAGNPACKRRKRTEQDNKGNGWLCDAMVSGCAS